MKPLHSLFLFSLCLSGAAFAQENVVTAPPASAAIVTIRTAGGLQISEARRVSLAAGENRVALPGLAPQIVENSLQTRFFGPGAIEIWEQSQRLATGSDSRAVLRRFIGKTVTLMRPVGAAGEKSVSGTLLQVDEAILLDTPDGVLVAPPGTFVVPRGERAASLPRALELLVKASAAGDYRAESNYLVEGGAWSANYRASLNAAGDQLELRGFLALQLPAGLEYTAAKILFEPQKNDGTLRPLLERPIDLSRGSRQEAFFSKTLPVTQRNVFRDSAGSFTETKLDAARVILRSTTPIGATLPSGALALYRERPTGPPELLNFALNASLENYPLEITLGFLPNVKIARRIVKSRQLNPVTMEYTVEITVSNASKTPQTLEIIEDLPSNPKISEADPQPVFDENERVLRYSVTVAPGGSTTLRYVVESKTA